MELQLHVNYVLDRKPDELDSRILKLATAVLERALLDTGDPDQAGEALEWISSPEKKHIFSFLFICRALGLSPTKIRAAIKKPSFVREFKKERQRLSMLAQGLLK